MKYVDSLFIIEQIKTRVKHLPVRPLSYCESVWCDKDILPETKLPV